MEAFYCVLQPFLGWDLVRYYDNFIALLHAVDAAPERIRIECNNYACFTDILGIPWQGTKNFERTVVLIFGIKVDTNFFTVRFSPDRLVMENELWETEIKKLGMLLFELQTLTSFLSFCAKVLHWSGTFMRSLEDFVVKFSPGHLVSHRGTLSQVRHNLSGGTNWLPKFNTVLFFHNERQKTY